MRYLIKNGANQTTASPVYVTTGTAIKTMLQFKPIVPCRVVEWGISFDGSAAATPGKVEFIESDVAATVTAFVTGDITRYDAEAINFGDPTSNYITVGTSSSGFTASSEGSTTVTRDLDGPILLPPTGPYDKQFPLGERPYIQAAKFARVRVLFGTAVNCYCWMIVEF